MSESTPKPADADGLAAAPEGLAPASGAAQATAARASAGSVDETTLDPQTLRALEFVRKLVRSMQMDAEVDLAPDDGEGSADEIRLEIESGKRSARRHTVIAMIARPQLPNVTCR